MNGSTTIPITKPVAESAPHENPAGTAGVGARLANLVGVLLPFFGLLAGMIFVWGWGFGWVELGLLLGMYSVTAIGITVGYHRLFTHRSFETNGVVKSILGILGSMALQGPLVQWVAVHRKHHHHSDEEGDPHSPHQGGSGFLGFLGGFWHAHVGWLFQPSTPDLDRYAKDLQQNRLLRTLSSMFLVWVALGLLIPAVLGGLLTGSWMGVLLGFLWGGLARIFLAHHVTWSINSVCHLWGQQPFASRDQSRNNLVFGILGFGEGWHNNHHAFPTSARHGLRWWQIDVSYWTIRALALVRLAWNVRLPTERALATHAAGSGSNSERNATSDWAGNLMLE